MIRVSNPLLYSLGITILLVTTNPLWGMDIQEERTFTSSPLYPNLINELRAEQRWNRSSAGPGVLIGAGSFACILGFYYLTVEGKVDAESLALAGGGLLSTTLGTCWGAINRCFKNLGSDIRSLATPVNPEDYV